MEGKNEDKSLGTPKINCKLVASLRVPYVINCIQATSNTGNEADLIQVIVGGVDGVVRVYSMQQQTQQPLVLKVCAFISVFLQLEFISNIYVILPKHADGLLF
jgi:hypothetical protein